jgi:phosphonate transport system permease protein
VSAPEHLPSVPSTIDAAEHGVSMGVDVEEAAVLARQTGAWRRTAAQAAAVVVVIIYCGHRTGLLDGRRLREGVPALFSLVGEMFPPKFEHARSWILPVFDTLAMSIAGTALAVTLSLGLALLAARSTAPHPVVRRLARLVLNLLRSIPELIMGIIFVAAVGFGALPGVLALGLHSVGMVGKLFAEILEHVDEQPIEAIRAAGASPLQVVAHGYLSLIVPQMADVIFYRWEYNFRASTVLGAVGAGGIGFELIGSLRVMEYQEVSAIILVILGMVTLVDGLGARLRRSFK